MGQNSIEKKVFTPNSTIKNTEMNKLHFMTESLSMIKDNRIVFTQTPRRKINEYRESEQAMRKDLRSKKEAKRITYFVRLF